MPDIDDIVQVTITDETEVVERAGFNRMLVIPGDVHTLFSDRLMLFTASEVTTGLLDLGAEITDDVYLQAQKAVSQNPRATQIYVGRPEAAETPAEVFAAIRQEDDSGWYGVCHATRTQAEIEAMAAAVEATNHLYLYSTADAAVAAGTAGNVMLALQAAGYRRTAGLYHAPDTEDYADCAFLSRGLGADLDAVDGQHTWSNKTLAGVTVDRLNGAQRTAIHDAYGNTYERRMGANITREGQLANGDYIDNLTTDDWTIARMTEDLYAVLNAVKKVPYSQRGLDMIEVVMRRRLDLAVRNGHFESYTVTMPTYQETLATDRSSRIVRGRFTAVRQGAIHRVIISGTVAA